MTRVRRPSTVTRAERRPRGSRITKLRLRMHFAAAAGHAPFVRRTPYRPLLPSEYHTIRRASSKAGFDMA